MDINAMLQMLHANRFETASVLLFVVGLAGMVFNRNLFKNPAVPASAEVYSNPLPAGLVLTGIVVSVSFTAFGLALTQRLYKRYGSLNIDEIMMRAQKSED